MVCLEPDREWARFTVPAPVTTHLERRDDPWRRAVWTACDLSLCNGAVAGPSSGQCATFGGSDRLLELGRALRRLYAAPPTAVRVKGIV